MSITKPTRYAPEIFRHLNGILLVHKQPSYFTKNVVQELRVRLCDDLNSLEPRPLSRRLAIIGACDEEKQIVDLPNLADHPLVVGPRYIPSELSLKSVQPDLGYRSSGLTVLVMGKAYSYVSALKFAKLPSVYHIAGEFGYKTHNHFYDGNILDKSSNYHRIRSGKLDSMLAKIESSQRDRLFDASRTPIHSQEAYELAQSWPSRPAKMATWPVIYRIRCIHLKLPHFKLEITATNESESYLAHVVNDFGIMLKTAAFTHSIRRVKMGPFSIDNALTEKQWDIQSILDNLKMNYDRLDELNELLRQSKKSTSIRTEYNMKEIQEASS